MACFCRSFSSNFARTSAVSQSRHMVTTHRPARCSKSGSGCRPREKCCRHQWRPDPTRSCGFRRARLRIGCGYSPPSQRTLVAGNHQSSCGYVADSLRLCISLQNVVSCSRTKPGIILSRKQFMIRLSYQPLTFCHSASGPRTRHFTRPALRISASAL